MHDFILWELKSNFHYLVFSDEDLLYENRKNIAVIFACLPPSAAIKRTAAHRENSACKNKGYRAGHP